MYSALSKDGVTNGTLLNNFYYIIKFKMSVTYVLHEKMLS